LFLFVTFLKDNNDFAEQDAKRWTGAVENNKFLEKDLEKLYG
jgi:hypothetical protein